MSTTTFILLLLGLVVVVYAGLAVRMFIRMRGTRVIVCPETNKPAAVTVDAAHAALSAVWELPEVRLDSCTRWPERADCNQACSGQIAVAPTETLAVHMLKEWYAGKKCAVCNGAIPPVHGGEPRPGLLNVASAGREILSWEDIPAEQLPAVLASHLPVCANCHIAESFRRQFPDLVTDRAPTDKRDLAVH
jgi:hypothetical protein